MLQQQRQQPPPTVLLHFRPPVIPTCGQSVANLWPVLPGRCHFGRSSPNGWFYYCGRASFVLDEPSLLTGSLNMYRGPSFPHRFSLIYLDSLLHPMAMNARIKHLSFDLPLPPGTLVGRLPPVRTVKVGTFKPKNAFSSFCTSSHPWRVNGVTIFPSSPPACISVAEAAYTDNTIEKCGGSDIPLAISPICAPSWPCS